MLTTCPHCSLTLAVTAADLRLGQGYVRCGRCVSVFNALISLTDDVVATVGGDEEQLSAKGTISVPALPDAAAPADGDVDRTEAPAKKAGAAKATGSKTAASKTAAAAQEGAASPEDKQAAATGTFETIVLEGDSVLQTEETVAESEVDAQLQALVDRFDAVRDHGAAPLQDWDDPLDEGDDDQDGLLLDYNENGEYRPPAAYGEVAPLVETTAQQTRAFAESDVPLEVAPDTRRRRQLIVGCIALGLLLLAQVVHHYRLQLMNVGFIGPAISGLYGLFGQRLEPNWDMAAYEVRQLGAEAVPGEPARIAVRASIRNAATRPQPPPLLRVVLQDRFGNRLSTREVSPGEYLRGEPPRLMQADQRMDVNLLLPDPGQKAVGFEIDACLKAADGALRCASDSQGR